MSHLNANTKYVSDDIQDIRSRNGHDLDLDLDLDLGLDLDIANQNEPTLKVNTTIERVYISCLNLTKIIKITS